MNLYFSRVPSDAVRPFFDGHRYAYVPDTIQGDRIVCDYNQPRLMRFTEGSSFIKGGEAYILIGRRGDSVPLRMPLPFGVSHIHIDDAQGPPCRPMGGPLQVAA